LKFEVRLKALSMRFQGTPEGGLKALQIKGFKDSKEERRTVPCSIFPFQFSTPTPGLDTE